MNKLTPGPWRVEDLGIPWSDALAVVAPDGGAICYTTRGLECRDEGDSRAFDHARLIAAAPDLLRALRQVVESAEEYNGMLTQAIVDNALAAIAKAEGK